MLFSLRSLFHTRSNRIAAALILVGTTTSSAGAKTIVRIPKEVRRAIPHKFAANPSVYADGMRRLEEVVRTCGSGVVEGAKSSTLTALKNSCSYQVSLDDTFFAPRTKMTGLLQEENWAYKNGVTWVQPNLAAELPDSFDLRDLMKSGQPEIRRQKCGDCWAWATHHGLEIARAIHDDQVVDLSIQTVLSCSRKGSCNGGYMSAVDFLKYGLPEENVFPYAASDKACKFSASQISTGWDGKVSGTPYIGSSLRYSLANRLKDGSFIEGTKVSEMMAALHEWQSPLVVTVAAYDISGPGIYDTCSSINSGGNHMVTIVGWDFEKGSRNAHVWNSWGQQHGEKGVSRIKWECGNGKLNRGLGVSAKIVQYKMPCTPPDAAQTYLREVQAGKTVQIGAPQESGVVCSWQPTAGLSDPNSCVTTATAGVSTEYHLTSRNQCGSSSSITLVHVWPASGVKPSHEVLTPFGLVSVD